jgi:hypothetical protein
MTFIPTANNNVSILNSTNVILTSGGEFLGTSENVARYATITITMKSNVDSAPLGVKLEFSSDNINWDIVEGYTYLSEKTHDTWSCKVNNKYFRVRYTNGAINQSEMRLQTRFEVTIIDTSSNELPLDGFGRVRVSEPYTLLTNNHVTGKNSTIVYENITGAATSVHESAKSHILMNTTGVGSVIRRSRIRAIYQPGKSLLIYMTGVLNNNTNVATVTTKIGYYDDDDGYYFQYNNGIMSIVERSSVSGVIVETIINQDSWNENNMDGTLNGNYIFDPTKSIIFWFNMEWLGVGFVDCGVIINGLKYKLHRFRHSNLLPSAYISTASLKHTYEIISTGGSGSMTSGCQTILSEGGFRPHGKHFSVNMGTATKSVGSTIEPLIVLKIKSGKKINAELHNVSVMSTSGANMLVEIWKFNDITSASILNNNTFVSANVDSDVEYNIAATSITTTNGVIINSAYSSNNNDAISFGITENGQLSQSANIPDIFAICVTSVGGNENYIGSVSWTESI